MMDTTGGEHRWHRPAYPLQISPVGVAQLCLGTPSEEEADESSLDRLQTDTQATNDPAGYHQDGLDDRAEHCSVVSHAKIDALSSHVSSEDVQAYDGPSPSVSLSQCSISPPSSSLDLKKAQGTSSSFHVLRGSQSREFRMLSPWTRNLYPPGTIIETAPEPHSPTSTLALEEEHEQKPDQVAKPHQSEATKKTSRRSSPSGRLSSPVLATAVREFSTEGRLEEDVQSMAASATSPWVRHVYPLQQNANDSSAPHSPPPQPKKESRLVNSPQSPRTHLTTLGASSSSSPRESEKSIETPTCHVQNRSQVANESKIWHRQKYPLQAPASNASLGDLLTPPQSPRREAEGEAEREVVERVAAERNAAARKAAEKEAAEKEAAEREAVEKEAAENEAAEKEAAEKEAVKREAAEREVAEREAAEREASEKGAAEREIERESAAKEAEREGERTVEREPEHTRKASADQSRENEQRASKSTTFRRQLYPLQSSASNTDLRHAISSSPSKEKGLPEAHEPSTLQPREKFLATSVVDGWRRQVYPLQSLKRDLPFQPSSTLYLPEAEAEAEAEEEKKSSPPPVHLPKNIPAITDAEKHDYQGRTIVVCLDGTGDKFDNDNSNIVHLISALKKDDPRQMTYYQAGIGTYGASGLSSGVTAAMDMAVGSSLGLHVREAYHFLMHTYQEGDRICIFGFSRGAYTARCLAGMIHKVGLLPPRNVQQISFAYEFYKKESAEGWRQSADFKKTFSIDISVYFLGCFDSVASVGIIPRQLPLSSTPTNKPRYFRHAMALDERRAKFKVCRHVEKDWTDIDVGSPTNATANAAQSDLLRFQSNRTQQRDTPPPSTAPQSRYDKSNHLNLTEEEQKRFTDEATFSTDVLEVWFAGAHSDIGGGAVPNDERHKLAQIPLRWMIRQAFECNTSILFKTAILAEYGLDVHMLWPKYERHNVPTHEPSPSILSKYEKALPPKSIRRAKLVPIDKREKGEQFFHLRSHTDEDWTPEQVEDFFDAMSPLNDQLVQAPSWWILEVLPVQSRLPTAAGEVSTRLGMNLGRYRGVEGVEPKVHWTVLHRMQHTGYKIEAGAPLRIEWQTVV